jgi:hypothetical protein
MSTQSRTLKSQQAVRLQRRRPSRNGLPSLSEKQTQAYLAARDVLRRILRTNQLIGPQRMGAMASVGPAPLADDAAAARREPLRSALMKQVRP